jgi:hypothetical protein
MPESSGRRASAASLLALHAAAQPFLRRRTHAEADARERLRVALIAVLRERGMAAPDLVDTPEEALAAFRRLLCRCEELHVNWADIVAVVNREWPEEERRHAG